MLARLRLQPPSTIDVPSVSLMLSYARQGLGISLVPGLALARGDRRRLVIERADVAPIDVHLVCRPTLKRTRAVARFLDGLAEEARRAAALHATPSGGSPLGARRRVSVSSFFGRVEQRDRQAVKLRCPSSA